MNSMGITLTEAAAARVQKFLADRGGHSGLRLGVKTTGCSGYAYVVDIADEIGADDLIFEDRGIKLIVSPKNLPFLAGMQLDYGRDGLNEGFKFQNPNAKATCGCGESFSV